MAVRVAINGLGRTGRAAFRAAHERGLDIEWVGLNDLMGVETLAHLLRHDTVYGPFPGTIELAGDAIVVDGVEIPVFAEAGSGQAAVGRARRRRRHRVDRLLPQARRRDEAHRGRRAQGDHLGARRRSRTSPSRSASTSTSAYDAEKHA